MNAIQAENVGIGVHFRAVHLHPYYAETFGFRRGMFPNAEYYSDRTISLPLYPKMTDADADDVIEAVRKVIAHYRRVAREGDQGGCNSVQIEQAIRTATGRRRVPADGGHLHHLPVQLRLPDVSVHRRQLRAAAVLPRSTTAI